LGNSNNFYLNFSVIISNYNEKPTTKVLSIILGERDLSLMKQKNQKLHANDGDTKM